MSVTTSVPASLARARSGGFDRWAVARIQHRVRSAPVRFVLWDGFTVPDRAFMAAGAIRFLNRRALLGWLWNHDLYFGETYMSGDVEIDGDLVGVLEALYRAVAPSSGVHLHRRSHAHRLQDARRNVHRHYDLGNDFYRLWLDREMLYTCAYFPTPDVPLEAAQLAKMDLVCRKLALKPGERVIEAGCGWGALALYMAKHYRVTVRAFNLSREQIAFARERARQERLGDRVEFVEDDYRHVRGTFDAFVSVGMLEHVGLPDFPALGRVIDRSLAPAGRGLLHFIGRDQPMELNPWIRRRIFPGAYPPALREVFEGVLEPFCLSVLDVQNLRLHYAKTLEHWRTRFEAAGKRIAGMFDDRFVRAWRLYLAGSEAAFRAGSLELFQVVFARGTSNAVPWTRVNG